MCHYVTYSLKCLHYADTISSALAYFNDSRCTSGGVCPTDPLTFTCEINEIIALRVNLPTGDMETVSLGNTKDNLNLPNGFTANSLVIVETDKSTRNFSLTLSVMNASLLNCGEIVCNDIIPNVRVMAGCPLAGEYIDYICGDNTTLL